VTVRRLHRVHLQTAHLESGAGVHRFTRNPANFEIMGAERTATGHLPQRLTLWFRWSTRYGSCQVLSNGPQLTTPFYDGYNIFQCYRRLQFARTNNYKKFDLARLWGVLPYSGVVGEL